MKRSSHVQWKAIVDTSKLRKHQVNKDKIRDLAETYADGIYDSLGINKDELFLAQVASDWSEIFDYEVDIIDVIDGLRQGVVVGEYSTFFSQDIKENLKDFIDNYHDVFTHISVDRNGNEWGGIYQFRMVKDHDGSHLEYCKADVLISYNDWNVA